MNEENKNDKVVGEVPDLEDKREVYKRLFDMATSKIDVEVAVDVPVRDALESLGVTVDDKGRVLLETIRTTQLIENHWLIRSAVLGRSKENPDLVFGLMPTGWEYAGDMSVEDDVKTIGTCLAESGRTLNLVELFAYTIINTENPFLANMMVNQRMQAIIANFAAVVHTMVNRVMGLKGGGKKSVPVAASPRKKPGKGDGRGTPGKNEIRKTIPVPVPDEDEDEEKPN